MHVIKARTFEAKYEARTLKAETQDIIFCPQGSSRPRPVLEDFITAFHLLSALEVVLN
jgi:hypothetical protein